MRSHKKCLLYRFSRFYLFWIPRPTNKNINWKAKYIYIYIIYRCQNAWYNKKLTYFSSKARLAIFQCKVNPIFIFRVLKPDQRKKQTWGKWKYSYFWWVKYSFHAFIWKANNFIEKLCTKIQLNRKWDMHRKNLSNVVLTIFQWFYTFLCAKINK